MRWEHPELGLMEPDRVHPDRRGDRADRADRRVGARTRRWTRSSAGASRVPGVTISVNLSARQLGDPDLVARLDRGDARRRPRPQRRCAWRWPRGHWRPQPELSPCASWRRCNELGITLAIDDFGTGHVVARSAVGAAGATSSRSTGRSSRGWARAESDVGPGRRRGGARATRSGSGSWPKGSRPTPSWPSCASSAATAPRASCSASRCLRRASTACSAPRSRGGRRGAVTRSLLRRGARTPCLAGSGSAAGRRACAAGE